jgi:uncharacterized protein with ATP-grasp and redox domains
MFALSKHWKTYDVFFKQKQNTFRSSRAGVIELAHHYKDVLKTLQSNDSGLANLSEEERTKAEEALFVEMGEICLWGNATDLSLLMHLSLEEIQKLQGAESRKANQEKIIANDFHAAFRVLKEAQRSGKKDRRVDIVLDNAGFELYVDLILAGYLLESGLATHIVLHPKNIPWFVSDVVPRDFADTLNVMQNAKAFYETPSDEDKANGATPVKLTAEEENSLDGVFAHWSTLYAEGKITLRPNEFWTHAGSFWRMPTSAPALVDDLKESELVIFKGDLNYRKLTGDVSPITFLDLQRQPEYEANHLQYRLSGTPRLPSPKPSALLVLALACVSCLSAPSKPMSLSVCPRAKTRSSGLWKAAAATAVPGSGRGVADGLSSA